MPSFLCQALLSPTTMVDVAIALPQNETGDGGLNSFYFYEVSGLLDRCFFLFVLFHLAQYFNNLHTQKHTLKMPSSSHGILSLSLFLDFDINERVHKHAQKNSLATMAHKLHCINILFMRTLL